MGDFLYHANSIGGVKLSAWVRKGRLVDLLLDDSESGVFIPESIFWGKVQKSLPGTGGYFITLPENKTGYLRNSSKLREGEVLLVQVSSYAQPNKQIPLQQKMVFKGHGVILTPGVPGINISKSITDPNLRETLLSGIEEVTTLEQLKQENIGLIFRTCCQKYDLNIKEEIENLLANYRRITQSSKPQKPALVWEGPSIHERAERDWLPEEKFTIENISEDFDDYGLWELINESTGDVVELNNSACLYIEKTNAMIVIDVNSGGLNSKASTRHISLRAAEVIPQELKIRGFAGKVVIDFPSMRQQDRNEVEKSLVQSFKKDYIPTKLLGWTKGGNYELQRKRDRRTVVEIKFV